MKFRASSMFPSLFLLASGPALAGTFVSGSTGADGAFAPTTDITVPLPAKGILNYTTVNIPAGVTVKFEKNGANTAVVILTTGNVNIAGTIDISGGASLTTKTGLAADSNRGGLGGPGGFDGGRGGLQEQNRKGGTGMGPGGGGGGSGGNGVGNGQSYSDILEGGGGGGFAAAGEASYAIRNGGGFLANIRTAYGGGAYGANSMLPLIGGSGGGGGSGGVSGWGLPGSGGGGGGGALMLVAAGSVSLTGLVNAAGGAAGNINNNACNYGNKNIGGAGGGGAGGAVRILTPSFSGGGSINVNGGTGGCRVGVTDGWQNSANSGGNGAVGRSSVEIVTGGTFNPSVIPTLTITSIGGVAVPPNPTGAGDVVLPTDQPNPVVINVAASGIPVGTLVKLTLQAPYADKVTADTTALVGTLQASTASGNISVPAGASVIMASTTYALSVAMGDSLKMYAGGERVEKVELAAVLGGAMKATLITVSGKEYEVPAAVLAMMAG